MIFADASFYQALLNSRDENHDEASSVVNLVGSRRVLTTPPPEWVLTELLNTFSRPDNARRSAARFISRLLENPAIEVVHADHASFQQALALYSTRPDKQWSLTDCMSFQLMWDRGITHALAFDDHFWQAGFTPFK